jgi:hypothetical protein
MNTLLGRLSRLATFCAIAIAMPLFATAPTLAGDNMAKVDIVSEGVDLKPIYVGATGEGYTGTEATAHKFMVRVFAKAAGQKRVWKVRIFGKDNTLFDKDVGKSEGWDVYGKSHEVMAKPQNLQWATYPIDACRDNMKKMIASGKTKAQVLANDRKVMATAVIEFSAWADTKANNKKDDHDKAGNQAHLAMTPYTVQVVCRAAL